IRFERTPVLDYRAILQAFPRCIQSVTVEGAQAKARFCCTSRPRTVEYFLPGISRSLAGWTAKTPARTHSGGPMAHYGLLRDYRFQDLNAEDDVRGANVY